MATSLTEVTELTVKPLQVKVSGERGLRTKHSNGGPENCAAPFNVGPFSEKNKWLESRNEDHMSLYGERIYKARNRACNNRLDICVGATSEKNVRSGCLNEVHMSQSQGLDTSDPRIKRYHISSAESPRKRVYNSPFSCLDTHHLKKTLSEPDISPRRRAADMELRPSKTTQELKTRWDKSSQNSPSLTRNRNSRQSILKMNSFNNNIISSNNNNINSNNNNNNNNSSNTNNSINDSKAQVQPENFYGLYTKQISVGSLQRKQFGSSHSQKPGTLSSQILSRYKVHNKPTLPSKPIKLEPTKLEPSSSLSLKSLTVYLPQLTNKTNPRDDPALLLAPNVQESRTSGNIDDQSVTEKQPKQESRSQERTSVPVLTTDAKSLAKCSKTPETRLTLAEQLYHYKKDIDLTRWMCEQHLEIVRRTLEYKPLRLVVISSKISSKQLLIDALTPNTVDLIYDYDSLTPSELIDAVQKKLDGKRVESLLLMCKGGPGYMYLLKNQAVTPAKIKNSRDTRLIWFWISLQTVMSKIQSESVQASVHLWVPRFTHNQQHHPLQHDLQQLLKPYKIHVEAVSWSNGQGANVLGQYFTINSLSLWLQQQQQYLDDDDDDDEDDDEQILQQILNPDNNLKQQIL